MRRLPLLASVLVTGLAAAPAAQAASFVAFQSPSRNIGCVLDATNVRCDISKHSWRAPAKPASCDLDYGGGVAISRAGRRGSFVCAGDTTLGAGRVLGYGRSLRRGRITCTSRQAGMTCRNGRGHGFRLSRDAYRLF